MHLMQICWLLAVISQLPYPVTPTPKTEEEAVQQVESSLLSLFGFKKRPKIDKSKLVIPKEMIEQYERQSGQKLETVNMRKPGLLTQSANTMRSFVHEETDLDIKFPGHHYFRLFFNITSIPKSEVLKTAELVLNRETVQWLGDKGKSVPEIYQTVIISDVLKPGIKGKVKPFTRVIDVKTIDTRESGSLSFNVHPAVVRWKDFPKDNYGILIQVKGHGENKTTPARHVRVRRSATLEDDDSWSKLQPVLFTYTDDQQYKQDVGREAYEKRIKRAANRRRKSKPACRRYSMYVDFKDVGWNNWIVAPPGYDAFYCSGECNTPYPEHMNTTNHAIVQTLIHYVDPTAVPRACCVPTQLTSISMLYVDDERRVVLKNYKEMTVVGCGCR